MPRPPTFYHPLRIIRKFTDSPTQADFAKRVGVSSPTIQAIENGKLEISKKLALRVERATGSDHRELLKGPSGRPLSVDGKNYSAAFFEKWCERLESATESTVSRNLEQIGFWTRLLVKAADSNAVQEKQNSNAIHLLNEALDSVCQECDLEQTIESLLTPLKRVEYQSTSPDRWISETSEPGNALGDIPRFHPSAKVVVSVEAIPRWAPGHPIPGESNISPS